MVALFRKLLSYLDVSNVIILITVENSEFPCTCGHFEIDHEYRDSYISPSLQYICWPCIRLTYDLNNKAYKPYHKFQPDNLKYLENKL